MCIYVIFISETQDGAINIIKYNKSNQKKEMRDRTSIKNFSNLYIFFLDMIRISYMSEHLLNILSGPESNFHGKVHNLSYFFLSIFRAIRMIFFGFFLTKFLHLLFLPYTRMNCYR